MFLLYINYLDLIINFTLFIIIMQTKLINLLKLKNSIKEINLSSNLILSSKIFEETLFL